MTWADAVSIADEQIAWWWSCGFGPEDAWRAMGLPWGWAVEWREVSQQMIRWLGEQQQPQPAASRRAA